MAFHLKSKPALGKQGAGPPRPSAEPPQRCGRGAMAEGSPAGGGRRPRRNAVRRCVPAERPGIAGKGPVGAAGYAPHLRPSRGSAAMRVPAGGGAPSAVRVAGGNPAPRGPGRDLLLGAGARGIFGVGRAVRWNQGGTALRSCVLVVREARLELALLGVTAVRLLP